MDNMNNDLKLSPAGAALIQEFEGLYLNAYRDPIGVLTIGWGHTNVDAPYFSEGDRWTKNQCEAVFYTDMVKYEDAVKRAVTVKLNQNQFDALVSFTYNCGEGNLKKSSLLRKVNQGDFTGAASQFILWNKAGGRVLNGLTRRRQAEAELFARVSDDDQPDEMVQQVDAPSKPSILTSKIATTAGTIGMADIAATAQEAASTKDAVKHLGMWDQIVHIAHNPNVWLGIALLVGIAGIIYWRWRDHQ